MEAQGLHSRRELWSIQQNASVPITYYGGDVMTGNVSAAYRQDHCGPVLSTCTHPETHILPEPGCPGRTRSSAL